VTSATLRIYANSGSSVEFVVSEVTDVSWTEGDITYANAPAVGAGLSSTNGFSARSWIEVDLTSHVAADENYVVAITTTSNTAISLAGRESANMAQLVITTAP